MAEKLRILHYLNQFFGGIGGEEFADTEVQVRDGPVGPGRLLNQALGESGSIVGTIICGDNYAAENWDQVLTSIERAFESLKPDVVVAGPAFDSGRYGLACAQLCVAAQKRGIPAVTAMHPESVGILVHRRELVAVPTGTNPAEMQSIMGNVAKLVVKLGNGQELGSAAEEGYVPRGFRRLVYHDKVGYERALDMLKARIEDRPFVSEVPLSRYEQVPPAPPISDLSGATVAFVVSSGVVPKGNPDRLPAARATQALKYSIADVDKLTVEEWGSAHGGFNTAILNTVNIEYALPLSSMRRLQQRRIIKGVHPYFYTTVGNQTTVNAAKDIGERVAKELKAAGVDAVLQVSG